MIIRHTKEHVQLLFHIPLALGNEIEEEEERVGRIL